MTHDDSADTLLRICETHNLLLPQNAIEWRMKPYLKGSLKGLLSRVFLVATDGIHAWFLLGDRETPFWGCLSNFVEEKEESQRETRVVGRSRKTQDKLDKLAQEE